MKLKLTFVFVFLSFSFFAQTEAVTKDGKKVVLYKNGTWKYAKAEASANASTSDLKKEALEFSMQLVRSYFVKDCSVLEKSIAAEIFSYKGTLLLNDEIRTKLCESVKGAIKDSAKTFKEYTAAYQIELLSKEEIEAKAKSKLPAHFNSTKEEFYFLGFEQKQPVTSATFINDRLFTLLLRKVDGRWLVKGFLSD